MADAQAPRQNPLTRAVTSPGRQLTTFHGYIGETTSEGTTVFLDIKLSTWVVIDRDDLVHVQSPDDDTRPATIFVRQDATAELRTRVDMAAVGLLATPDLPAGQALPDAGPVALAPQRPGPQGTSRCASQHCSDFAPWTDAYSSCHQLCQCLNETDNPWWRCVAEAARSSWRQQATARA